MPLPLVISIVCWFVFEIGLQARDLIHGRRRRERRDRGTRALVTVALGISVLSGPLLRTWAPALDTPAPTASLVVGLTVFWLGAALRAWAVVTLGGSFRTFISVDAEQTVVSHGPYRWVRHPSYSGLLLIALGVGITAANWLSIVASVAAALAGLVPRIAIEEAELTHVLGAPYRAYQSSTRRLVPGLW